MNWEKEIARWQMVSGKSSWWCTFEEGMPGYRGFYRAAPTVRLIQSTLHPANTTVSNYTTWMTLFLFHWLEWYLCKLKTIAVNLKEAWLPCVCLKAVHISGNRKDILRGCSRNRTRPKFPSVWYNAPSLLPRHNYKNMLQYGKKNKIVYEEKLKDMDLHDQQETFFNFDKQLFPEFADIRTIK